jgi:hypothetical protein
MVASAATASLAIAVAWLATGSAGLPDVVSVVLDWPVVRVM